MAHNLKIKSIDTAYSQASNSHFIDVEVEVFEGEQSIGTRRYGYALGTSKDEIVADLQKVKATLDSEKEQAVKNAELDANLADATNLSKELTDTEI